MILQITSSAHVNQFCGAPKSVVYQKRTCRGNRSSRYSWVLQSRLMELAAGTLQLPPLHFNSLLEIPNTQSPLVTLLQIHAKSSSNSKLLLGSELKVVYEAARLLSSLSTNHLVLLTSLLVSYRASF